jgi:hypothetical protein
MTAIAGSAALICPPTKAIIGQARQLAQST